MQAYFDNSATTPVSEASAQAVRRMLRELYGNPSSLHGIGIAAEQEIKKSRKILAGALGCAPEEIVFCSGGTESNNTAVFGAAKRMRRFGNRIVTTAVEHASVLEPLKQLEKEGFQVVYLKPDGEGRITGRQIAQAVTADTILVSIMLCNNETGAVFPVESAAAAVKEKGAKALIHCDAVQAFTKMPLNLESLGVDLLSVSAHKLHGPKGIGALYIKKGVLIPPLLHGGGQENGRRAGTESTPLIAGFAAAVRETDGRDHSEKVAALRRIVEEGLSKIPDITVNSPKDALPYILNFSVPGIRSETLLHYLEQHGVYVSSASACSGREQSHVLKAQGLSKQRIDSALRVSFSRLNTQKEAELLIQALREAVQVLRAG